MIIRLLTIVILLGIIIANVWGWIDSNMSQTPYSSGPTAAPNMEAPSYPPPNSN